MVRTFLFLLAQIGLPGQIAPPAISPRGVVNAASRMAPTLAGGSIARGSLFHIVGPRLGPTVRLNGRPVAVLSETADRIVARMPADAAAGDALLTVERDGQISEPFSMKIVSASFGIFEVAAGPELSSATRAHIEKGQLTTTRRPPQIRPGEPVYIFGTGLGDATAVRVFIGSKRVKRVLAVEHLRDFPGVDRIAVEPAAGTSEGCYVPVMVETGGVVSNAWAIGIASGATCRETLPWLSTAASGRRRSGTVLLTRTSLMTDANFAIRNVQFAWDNAAANFTAVETADSWPLPLPPEGACTVYSGVLQMGALVRSTGGGGALDDVVEIAAGAGPSQTFDVPPVVSLDAGPRISIEGDGTAQDLRRSTMKTGSFAALLGGRPPFGRFEERPLFLGVGEFRIASAGGSEVGAFTRAVTLSKALVWTNRKALGTVRRGDGLRVKWTGADDRQSILIAAMNVDGDSGAVSAALCVAAAKWGHFRVPPHVLANIPPGRSASKVPTNLVVLGSAPRDPTRFAAEGLDTGIIVDLTALLKTVRFE